MDYQISHRFICWHFGRRCKSYEKEMGDWSEGWMTLKTIPSHWSLPVSCLLWCKWPLPHSPCHHTVLPHHGLIISGIKGFRLNPLKPGAKWIFSCLELSVEMLEVPSVEVLAQGLGPIIETYPNSIFQTGLILPPFQVDRNLFMITESLQERTKSMCFKGLTQLIKLSTFQKKQGLSSGWLLCRTAPRKQPQSPWGTLPTGSFYIPATLGQAVSAPQARLLHQCTL